MSEKPSFFSELKRRNAKRVTKDVAMRLEDFKAHLRTIAGEDPKQEITGAARPHRLLVRNRKKTAPKRRRH